MIFFLFLKQKMATKISTEILFNNLQLLISSTQDLYLSLIVNRIWCKVTIPILWELPLIQESRVSWKKALCIRTYMYIMHGYLS